MKKFLVVMVVLALVGLGSIAFAADVTVGGSLQIRSRDFNDMTFYTNQNFKNQVDTQERIIMNINAKAGDDVKGKISLWQDFYDWGSNLGASGASTPVDSNMGTGFGSSTAGVAANTFGFREAWISFNVPGIPVNLTAGHQLLQLGDGWFFRAMHFGADAWVVANVTGANTVAFVDVKASEGSVAVNHDDVDGYVLLDVLKLDDNNTIGGNLADIHLGTGNDLYNLGLNYAGKLGPLNLKAQADFQGGQNKNVLPGNPQPKYQGYEIAIKGNVMMDAVTINFLLGAGSGKKDTDTSPNVKTFVTLLDIDPHYTFLYEYKISTAAKAAHTGLANTEVISVGAMFAAAKSVQIGADIYFLMATEKVNNALTEAGAGSPSSDIGTEIDAHVNWKIYDNLSWNWDLGYFMPGGVYKDANGNGKDAAYGIQGILAFNF